MLLRKMQVTLVPITLMLRRAITRNLPDARMSAIRQKGAYVTTAAAGKPRHYNAADQSDGIRFVQALRAAKRLLCRAPQLF
jgi:hypothetical protein